MQLSPDSPETVDCQCCAILQGEAQDQTAVSPSPLPTSWEARKAHLPSIGGTYISLSYKYNVQTICFTGMCVGARSALYQETLRHPNIAYDSCKVDGIIFKTCLVFVVSFMPVGDSS